MFRYNVRLHQCLCLILVMCVVTITAVQPAFCNDSNTIISQKSNFTYVEKQPLTENELLVLSEPGKVDLVTAGHRPVPVPHGRAITSDIFFWAGFSLIMLSVVIYPY